MRIVVMQLWTTHGVKSGLACFEATKESQHELWAALGHRVIEVSDEDGEKILARESCAMKHQIHLKEMFDEEPAQQKEVS